jgi:hypothetical protein
MKTYKICEVKDGKIKTLFHGVNNSKVVKQGVWIEGEVKQGRDGSGDRWYLTGWHTLPTLEDAKAYMSNFNKRLDLLHIIECEVKDTWLKEHSNANVILSRWIKFGDIVY